MSYPHQHEPQPMPRSDEQRGGFAGPRLELPRFTFAPPDWRRPSSVQPLMAPTTQAPVTYAQPAPTAYAPVVAHAHAPAPAPRRVPAPMANTTTPASVSWDRVAPPAERTLLQRISPVHMGVLLVVVMIAMVVTSGPASMTAKPGRLPALATGGGAPGDVPVPVRAGATAVDAVEAAPAQGRAAKATATARTTTKAPRARARGARVIVVGNARLRANVRAGGIPSPAAAANLAVAGGGRVSANSTGTVRMGGIPSPAASEQLGPQELPFRPTDGVTLPRVTGERDGHAVDRHYGATTLAMEEPALPAMTPGAAAARAEQQVQINELTGGSAPAPVVGGLAMAY